MKGISITKAIDPDFPEGLLRLDYISDVDDRRDWALLRPGNRLSGRWIVVIHGHGSHGDQLFKRADIRTFLLPKFLESGCGILSVNLRDNAWMNPAAAFDLHELIAYLRADFGLVETIFCSGSMGGTSNLIYAVLHPEDVSALICLGAATDIGSYLHWCERQTGGSVIRQISSAIRDAYGGTPAEQPELYLRHSAVANASKLTMPLQLIHGGADTIIPVEQARALVEKLQGQENFHYREIPDGNHDSPLFDFRGPL